MSVYYHDSRKVFQVRFHFVNCVPWMAYNPRQISCQTIITKYVAHENEMLFVPLIHCLTLFFLLFMLSCVTSFLWVSIDWGGGGKSIGKGTNWSNSDLLGLYLEVSFIF